MLKHLGEALVPFEDDGFGRTPETPLAGQAVTVRCRADGGSAAPLLIVETAGGERVAAPAAADGNRYAFSLGAFAAGQSVRYRFFNDGEQTPWFAFDVNAEETVQAPLGLYRAGDALQVALCPDVTLTLRGGEAPSLTLTQQPAAGEPVPEATLALPGEWSLTVGEGFIWKLNRLSKPVCEGLGYLLRRDSHGRVTRATLRMRMQAGHVLGTGERFEAVDMLGHATNGRVVEKFTRQGEQTYLPMPFFMTDRGLGWYRAGSIPAEMRFSETVEISQETEGATLTVDELFFGAPQTLLQAYVARTGQPALPPEWAFGVWISANGWKCDADVDEQLAALTRFQYPATVLVLEQWSDERTFYRWHPQNWRDPAAMVKRVRAAGLHLVLWQIPVIKHQWDGEPGEALQSDAREAAEKGYAVRAADGTPYRITERWFHHSMLPDFTNPEAVRWWFGKRKPLLQMGVEGFKTDGGEFLFDRGARLAGGQSGLAAHNLYPGLYLGAYRDFMAREGVAGVLFSRADSVGAQTRPIHWAGDQRSEWGELQACLNAGISAGLSGVLFWSFDIGGFAGPLPTAELYLRATALGCFCPVMQWHAEPRGGQFGDREGVPINNDRSPWNLAEALRDERVLTLGCSFARLRDALRPYLWREAAHCAQAARPMMAHLCLDWPGDPEAWNTQDEYMLGRELLVAPLVHEGEDTRDVYLPQGEWEDYFTGEAITGGRTLRVACPLERIPVYLRRDIRAGRED